MRARSNGIQLANGVLLAAWVIITLILASRHVFWRDEVRAMSFAISGSSLGEMVATVRGDGHPLLWYLLLRPAVLLFGKAALPVLAWVIALGAVILLLWRAPFTTPIKAMILGSHIMLWDFSVMARNYGLSMLLMFAFAATYRPERGRIMGSALLLALLANTNVHAMLIAWLLLAVWLVDLYPCRQVAAQWLRRQAIPAVMILMLATAACIAAVFPTINDAAIYTEHRDPVSVIKAVLLPGYGFVIKSGLAWPVYGALSAVLYASLFLLWPRRSYFLAGLLALWGFSLFFTVIYPGSERHIGLWLLFVITLNWMDTARRPSEPAGRTVLWWTSHSAFILLLVAELVMAGLAIADQWHQPYSRARDLAQLLTRDPSLARAIIMADPDTMIETLPYYAPGHRVYRIRPQAFGPLNLFAAKGANLDITISDILASAQQLRQRQGVPVVILLQQPLCGRAPATYSSGYNWTTSCTPQMGQQWHRETKQIADLRGAVTDEGYQVFVLN